MLISDQRHYPEPATGGWSPPLAGFLSCSFLEILGSRTHGPFSAPLQCGVHSSPPPLPLPSARHVRRRDERLPRAQIQSPSGLGCRGRRGRRPRGQRTLPYLSNMGKSSSEEVRKVMLSTCAQAETSHGGIVRVSGENKSAIWETHRPRRRNSHQQAERPREVRGSPTTRLLPVAHSGRGNAIFFSR